MSAVAATTDSLESLKTVIAQCAAAQERVRISKWLKDRGHLELAIAVMALGDGEVAAVTVEVPSVRSIAWVIHVFPEDYPGTWCLRRETTWTDGRILLSPEATVAWSLEDARQFIPAGLTRTLPSFDDAPHLVERWQ